MATSPPPVPGFHVGNVAVDVPLVLAPMEDVSNLPFRLICKRIGRPGLMFTEFVSAMAVRYNPKRSVPKMRVHPNERPLAVQIFGAEPDSMADSARIAQDQGADIVDINMGCWVPKVCRTGSGAALLKDPDTAVKIVEAVVKAVSVPVTVKVRAGWTYEQFAAPDLARRFQDAGIQMLTLHARFAKQGFEGQADWDLIRQLREVVTVPLIGNGDVKTAHDARTMVEQTGCDGVMVGRAAISDPWAVARIRSGLTGEPEPPQPTIDERIAVAIEHAELMVAAVAQAEAGEPIETAEQARLLPDAAGIELRAVRSLRGQLPVYIKGQPGAAAVRGSLNHVSSVAELQDILGTYRESLFTGASV